MFQNIKSLFTRKNAPAIICSIITIIGALFVRLYGLGDYWFTSDDSWHLVVAGQPTLRDVIQYNFHEEVHPPLSYIIWHLMLVISDNPLWLRSSSIAPGILLIPSMYIFGKRYISKPAGYAMAMVAAFGALPVTVGVSIRAYVMMMVAATWGAIFVHKYHENPKRKYLAYYFLVMFAAIALNHGAAFIVFVFGTMLMASAFKKKSYFDLAIIIAMHAALASFTLGYGYILEHYYWGGKDYDFFSYDRLNPTFKNNVLYLWGIFLIYLGTFSQYTFYADLSRPFLFIPCAIAAITSLIMLIKKREWVLVYIVYSPILMIVLCDYFLLYPLSIAPRNNLFIFLSFSVLVGYFAEISWQYCYNVIKNTNRPISELLNDKEVGLMKMFYIVLYQKINAVFPLERRLNFLKQFVIIIIPALLVVFVIWSDFYRKDEPGSIELSFNNSDLEEFNQNYEKLNSNSNIFITDVRMVWNLLYIDKDKAKITYITENLAYYKSDRYEFYFTAFPGIKYNVTRSLFHWKQFYVDLVAYLKEHDQLSGINRITYFAFGDNFSVIDNLFVPRFISSKEEKKDGKEEELEHLKKVKLAREERDNLSWAIFASNQVPVKIKINHSKSSQHQIIFFGFEPEFIKENILDKDFVNTYELHKQIVAGDDYKK